jgi:nitrogen fixation NifU-like protein
VTLDHFFNPRNARKLQNADVVGKAGNPEAGGPFMVLYLKLEGERIAEAATQTYGCCAAIAAASVLTEKVKGTTRSEAALIDEGTINDALGGLPMEKRHCSALAARVLGDALSKINVQSQQQ